MRGVTKLYRETTGLLVPTCSNKSDTSNFDFSKEESSASVVYNYKHGFSGFAAMLTPEQAEQLAGKHLSHLI
jgi:hypothetical protein